MKKIFIALILIATIVTPSISVFADMYSPYRDGFIEGYVKHIGENSIAIEEYDGTLHTLNLLMNTEFSIDGITVKLKDFKPGMEIYAELKGRSISYIESYSTDNLGYIGPEGKRRVGIVNKIDRNQIVLSLKNGQTETIFTAPTTVLLKQGQNAPLSTLYEGDNVQVYFDEVTSSIPSKIVVEGRSIIIKNIYKGRLVSYDNMEDYIILNDVEVLKNSQWQEHKDGDKIYFKGEIPVYVGGYKLPYPNLNYYKGKTVYLAVKEIFGREAVEKLVVQNQYEATYSNKIEEINWYSEAMELSNKRNISFNEGTIFVKNDRLVDSYSINPKSDAFIVADGRGSNPMADVVYVYNEDINNSNIGQSHIYMMRFDEILQYNLTSEEFFLLDKNEWLSFDEEKEFYYDNDTYLFDTDNEKELKVEEFYAGNYAVDEDSDYYDRDKNLRDWYGYVYTDGDRIVAANVQEKADSLLRQRVTTGMLEQPVVDDPMIGLSFTITNARDWSERKDQWMAKNTSLRLILNNAAIIKDNKVISHEDLRVGDRLYLIRDDLECKMIIVK